MRAVVQRVSRARVSVEDMDVVAETGGEILMVSQSRSTATRAAGDVGLGGCGTTRRSPSR